MVVKDKEKLPLDDAKVVKQYVNDEVLTRIEHEQCIVVLLGNNREIVQHADGTRYTLLPKSFSACPTSAARDYIDRDDAIVLTMEEAKKYINMSKNASMEVNKDIIEYNKKVDEWNEKLRRGLEEGPRKVKKRYRFVQENGPYHHLMRELEKKKSMKKKTKKKAKKTKGV